MQKLHFIISADVVSSHFTDSGLFGLTVVGAGSHSVDLVSCLMEELHKLREPINETELRRAKNLSKIHIMMALESSANRCDEMSRHLSTYGKVDFQAVLNRIDQVTSNSINRAATKML
jgi:predicted Zn-dependent peptidase